MMHSQITLMKVDLATGEEKPYPSHAGQWRTYHGESTAWLFNPWAAERRTASDVGSDPQGRLIRPPGEVLIPQPQPQPQPVARVVVKKGIHGIAWLIRPPLPVGAYLFKAPDSQSPKD